MTSASPHARSETTKRLKRSSAPLALTALLLSVLAVSPAGGTETPDNADNPPPTCKAADAPDVEPHEKTTGHFVLFDAYWEDAPLGSIDDAGEIAINYCPALLTTTTGTDEDGETTTATSLTASTSSAETLIVHVLDKHQATVVAADAEDIPAKGLSLAQYVEVDEPVDADDQVWWLRLDDPNTEDIDEQSDLTVGFSTLRFDEAHWAPPDDNGEAFRYRFVHEREPGIDPDDLPHFFAYRAREDARKEGARSTAELVWDSFHVGTDDMEMAPGELEDLQWVFTEPGTYEISVQLLGYVRDEARPEDGADWTRISPKTTETSKTQKYVFHVGDELPENEPPLFGVNLSVAENSPAGTAVGEPIPVYQAEADTLYYTLSGESSELFTVPDSTEPHQARVTVAEGAVLDFETKSTYDLILGVSDDKDHESNFDDTVDDTLAVRITLTDVPTGVVIEVSNPQPVAGEAVTFTAKVTDWGIGRALYYTFTDVEGTTSSRNPHHVFTNPRAGWIVMQLDVWYYNDPVDTTQGVQSLSAEPVRVTWSASDS